MKTIFKNISELLTLEGAAKKNARHVKEEDLTLIRKAALVVEQGKIIWFGEQKKIPNNFAKKSKEIDMQFKTVLPGFVECHTHSLFAGSRSKEFELRNQGVSYQEINARGGGIQATTKATRMSSNQLLKKLLDERIKNFYQQGVTTLEVKTGYALDKKNEIRCLKILNENYPIQIVPTYLGAHSVPTEFTKAIDYLNYSSEEILPKIKKLTSRVDIFIEKGFFTADLAQKYLEVVKNLGFQITIHSDQLSLSGGSELAVSLGAISADHLLQVDDKEIQKLAKSEVTCVLLPVADLYMKCAYPKARQMIDQGCRVALATDFNPGSSPSQNLNLVGLLARLEMKMTLPEVIVAYTLGGSYALGLQDQVGSLAIGKNANFLSIEKNWDQLFYSVGEASIFNTFYYGKKI